MGSHRTIAKSYAVTTAIAVAVFGIIALYRLAGGGGADAEALPACFPLDEQFYPALAAAGFAEQNAPPGSWKNYVPEGASPDSLQQVFAVRERFFARTAPGADTVRVTLLSPRSGGRSSAERLFRALKDKQADSLSRAQDQRKPRLWVFNDNPGLALIALQPDAAGERLDMERLLYQSCPNRAYFEAE